MFLSGANGTGSEWCLVTAEVGNMTGEFGRDLAVQLMMVGEAVSEPDRCGVIVRVSRSQSHPTHTSMTLTSQATIRPAKRCQVLDSWGVAHFSRSRYPGAFQLPDLGRVYRLRPFPPTVPLLTVRWRCVRVFVASADKSEIAGGRHDMLSSKLSPLIIGLCGLLIVACGWTAQKVIQAHKAGVRDFQGADLAGASLEWANLEWANLQGANLQRATLDEADLSRADLENANFEGASLQHVCLSGADLRGANFKRANLREADLGEAKLFKANLQGADLSGAFLQDAYLSQANLYLANLAGANLFRANVEEANLFKANLSGANFREADLGEANLSDANLHVAGLGEANLAGANLAGANLKGALLEGADVTDANLSRARLEDASLREITYTKTVEKEVLVEEVVRGPIRTGQFTIQLHNMTARITRKKTIEVEEPTAIFDGASYNANTIFPVGFAPQEFGMRPTQSKD